jgi:hypothetical protein
MNFQNKKFINIVYVVNKIEIQIFRLIKTVIQC